MNEEQDDRWEVLFLAGKATLQLLGCLVFGWLMLIVFYRVARFYFN